MYRYSKDKKVYNWILILIQCCQKIVKRFLINGISCIYFNENWINSTIVLIAFNSLQKILNVWLFFIWFHLKWFLSYLFKTLLIEFQFSLFNQYFWILNETLDYCRSTYLHECWKLNQNHCFIDEYFFLFRSLKSFFSF